MTAFVSQVESLIFYMIMASVLGDFNRTNTKWEKIEEKSKVSLKEGSFMLK